VAVSGRTLGEIDAVLARFEMSIATEKAATDG
jgi:hypothetical protein